MYRFVTCVSLIAVTSLYAHADAPANDPAKAQTELCSAITAGDAKGVASALDKGARLDRDCPEQMLPPLLHAVEAGKVEIVSLLLDRGADVNQKDSGVSATPMHYAVANHNAAMVKLLAKRGGNPNALTDEGLSPLAFVLMDAEDDATAQALLEAGADANAVNEQGDTLLDTALAKGYKKVAALLESKGGKRGEDPGAVASMKQNAKSPTVPATEDQQVGRGKPEHVASPVPMAAGNRTQQGRLVFKGLYLGMPLRDAVERFRGLGFAPDEFPDQAIGKKLEERIIVRADDGSLVVRRRSTFLNGWMLKADANGNVTRIVIAEKAVNKLFDAENAADQEFFTGFVKGYGLEKDLHPVEVKVWSEVRVPELGAPESCGAIEYIDPSGWYITLNDFRDIDYGLTDSRPRVKFD